MSYFQNKVAIITGSSRGIGFAIAKELIANGALVMLNGRDEKRLQAAQSSLSYAADRIDSFAGDVAQEESANALISACLERFGKIDFFLATYIGGSGGRYRRIFQDYQEILHPHFWSSI